MSLHHAAKHLASKGRNGDSTLVHMTKGEVAGLQAIAKKHGTTLTINPETGLPEAFGLKALIPIAAGIALGPAGFGIASSAMGAGLMVGGAYTLATGSLKQGLIAGLGAYGGAGLSGAGEVAGTQAMAGEGAGAGAGAGGAPVSDAVGTSAETINAGGSAAPATQQYAGAYQPTSFSSAPADLATETQAYSATPTNYSAFGDAPAPTGYESPSVTDATQQQASASYGTAEPVSSSTPPKMSTFEQVAARAEAKPSLLAATAAPIAAEEMQRDPYNPPEIKRDSDMGQRYAYDSGYDNSVPGRTSQPSYTAVSNEEAKKIYGFAEGGDVQYPYGESVMRMAEGGQANAVGYGINYAPGQQFGPGIDYSGYDTAPNVGIAAAAPRAARAASVAAPSNGLVFDPVSRTYVGSGPSGNTIYQGGGQYGLDEAGQKAADEAAAAAAAPVDTGYAYAAQGGLMQSYSGGGMSFSGDPSKGSGLLADAINKLKAQGAFSGEGQSGDTGTGYTYDPQTKQYTPNMAAGGGISTLGGYSDGGRLLKGPGDGMSDNIPAQIGAKQPARLADGEFVVPADVVSHLGNGSTDAGAKQLYKMMDKIRQARTGNKRQGKQINPNKFVPA